MRVRFALLVALSTLLGCGGVEEVPTARVQRGDFLRTVTAEGVLEAVESTPVSVPVEAEGAMVVAWVAPDGSRVEAGDVVVRFDATGFEKQKVEAVTDERQASLRLESSDADAETIARRLERDVTKAERELEVASRFRKVDETIFSRRELAESTLDEELSRRRRDHARREGVLRGELSGAERGLLQLEKERAEFERSKADRGIAAVEVTAPHAGLLVLERFWDGDPWARPGRTLWRGVTIGEIPDLSQMKAEVFVLEADAGGLAVGQRAEVRVEAHPSRVIAGTVTRVDALAQAQATGSPVQFFGADVGLTETVPEIMKPGARVRTVIFLDEIEDALLLPIQAVFERDGQRIVWRRGAGRIESVAVETGPTSAGRIVVLSGLDEGDEVVLEEPDEEEPRP